MNIMRILLLWFTIPVLHLIFFGLPQLHDYSVPSDNRQVIAWTESGPVPAGQGGMVTQFAWGNLETWSHNPVLYLIVMRLSDFVLFSLPGFFTWLLFEFVEFYSEDISDGPADSVHPDHI
jgi:hypothetical protein